MSFSLKILLSSWEYPQSMKNPKKNIHDKLKGQKGYYNWFIFLKGDKRAGWREKWKRKMRPPEKGWEKRTLNLPSFFWIPFYYFNHGNIKDGFNWLCSEPVWSILEAVNLEAIPSQLKAKSTASLGWTTSWGDKVRDVFTFWPWSSWLYQLHWRVLWPGRMAPHELHWWFP